VLIHDRATSRSVFSRNIFGNACLIPSDVPTVPAQAYLA
jgi:hypothetical protein